MQIYGPAHLHGPQGISAPHHAARPAATSSAGASSLGRDELQISSAAQILARLAEVPDIRSDRVAAIRSAIAGGTYETTQKLDAALDRLLDEIG